MAISRRDFVKATLAAGAVAGLAPACVTSNLSSTQKSGVKKVEETFAGLVKELGFEKIDSLSLITGHEYNAGLRYDDSEPSKARGRIYKIQKSARVEDIEFRNKIGYLPYFTIASCRSSTMNDISSFSSIMLLLREKLKLDPRKMSFTSTSLINDIIPELKMFVSA